MKLILFTISILLLEPVKPQGCLHYFPFEYNKIEKLVKIVRKGFPGKNREILLTYSMNDIKSIGIKISEGLNPERIIYLCLKDERKIPLLSAQQPVIISESKKSPLIYDVLVFEEQAADLAKFLQLNLESL